MKHPGKILFLAVTLLFLLTQNVDLFPNEPSSPWKHSFHRVDLSSDLDLVYQKDTSSAITVLQILIKGGKSDEPPAKKGLAYLSLRFALEISDNTKLQSLMGQATRLYLISHRDHSMLTLMTLSDHFEDSFKMLSEIILDPLISSSRIDRLKKMMDYLRKAEQDDLTQTANLVQMENLFGRHPYSKSIFGTKQSLKSITKKDIEDLYKDLFSKERLSLVVSSDLDQEKVVEVIDKYFNNVPSNNEKNIPRMPPPSLSSDVIHFIKKDKQQSFVSLAFSLDEVSPRTLILGSLLEHALGKGIGSRLWPLRAKDKLAYSVGSRLTQMKDGGMLELTLVTDNQKQDSALEGLKRVIMDIQKNGMTEQELETTKTYAKSSFLIKNESKDIRTRTIAFFLAQGADMGFINGYFQEIDKTTLDEINSFIQRIIQPDKGISLIIGPDSDKSEL